MFRFLIVGVLSAVCVSAAGVFPIEENPIPSWASKADSCSKISTCDRCAVSDVTYCFYNDDGRASCCKQAESNAAPASSGILSASVGPIEEDPIPSWASDSDSCSAIKSCDNCAISDLSYCYYTDAGQATCCKANNQTSSEDSGVLTAAVLPIEEDPVPAWASDSDVCNVLASCDNCAVSEISYCFYTEAGAATCCKQSQNSTSTGVLVASVVPIEEDPVPLWASKSDLCLEINTCDKCEVVENASYCYYKESGEANCCNRQNVEREDNSVKVAAF